jgi:hypothetical protein
MSVSSVVYAADKGLDLHPALVALMQWGDRYLADLGGPAIEVVHQECGAPVRAVVECLGEHVEVGPRSSQVRALR